MPAIPNAVSLASEDNENEFNQINNGNLNEAENTDASNESPNMTDSNNEVPENISIHDPNDSITFNDFDEMTNNENSIDEEDFFVDNSMLNDENDFNGEEFFADNFCPLHTNTDCTVSDVLLMIQAYSLRHNLSWTATEDLANLINIVVGAEKVPPSKHLLKRKFKQSIKSKPVKHFVCRDCKLYLGTLDEIKESGILFCPNCQCKIQADTKYAKNHFVTIPLREQLQMLLERNSDNLIFNARQQSNDICDVHDSISFRNIDNSENTITLTFSTDGAALFKATKEKGLWPLQLIVNEISLEHRFRRRNMLCVAVSFGVTPNMQTFFKPFLEEIQQINDGGGLSFKMENGRTKTCKVLPMIFTGDTLAKQYVLKKGSFNGYLGCPYCLHSGTLVNRQVRYCNRDNGELRTDEKTRHDMQQAQLSGEKVNGYLGISPLVAIENFDTAKQIGIDKMHNIDMGVERKIFDIILDKSNRKKE